MGLLRDLSDADRSQYDKYFRPKAANVRRAPVKNAASDVGGTTPEELVRAQLETGRSAPPGLGQTDIVRGKPRKSEKIVNIEVKKNPTYNPSKGDIGIKGSFDRTYIDDLINDTRAAVKGFDSTANAELNAANDARDIESVLGILRKEGIGTGPDAMANLKEERKMDPVVDYNDQSLLDRRSDNYNKMIEGALGSAGSSSPQETLFNFGFGPDPNAPKTESNSGSNSGSENDSTSSEPDRLSLDEISKKYGQFSTFGHRDYQAATDLGYTDDDIMKYLNENLNRLSPDNRPGGSAGLYDEILRGAVDLSKAVDIVR